MYLDDFTVISPNVCELGVNIPLTSYIHDSQTMIRLDNVDTLVYQVLFTDKVSRVLSYKEHSMKGFPLYHMFSFYNMHPPAPDVK